MLRFRRVKKSALTGETVVRYSVPSVNFMITASKAGLAFTGEGEVMLTDQKDLQEFAKVMSEAWADHRKLVPNLMADLEGQLPLFPKIKKGGEIGNG